MKVCPSCKTQYEDNITFCKNDGDVLESDINALIGTILDNQYRIEAFLGKGGMGTVYRARHNLLGDLVAIKILPAHMSNDPNSVRRFLREGQAARRFRHPNVVAVHDMRNTDTGLVYLVMEYIDGHTLKDELKKRKRFTPAQALEVLEPIANALNAAHAMGVVHRDLKTDNIMLGKTEDGQQIVKLLDLGIAKINEDHLTQMTRTGEILGTPAYMSPEHWGSDPKDGGLKIDGRADIYSLGVVFYELLAGHLPFEGTSIQELAAQHVLAKPTPIHEINADVPVQFGHAIARAMAKNRSERFATCEEFVQELRAGLAQTRSLPTLVSNEVEVRIGSDVELKMHRFEFEVVTLNPEGLEVDRRHGQAQCYTEDLGGVKLDMVWIPDGSFMMGSPDNEIKRSKEEGPQHLVTMMSFFISKLPITQAQWRAVAQLPQVSLPLAPDPSNFKGDDRPVESVSWEECIEFCARLSAKTGHYYTLPSEAQWEYACRAGTQTPFHFGETIVSELANYNAIMRYGAGPKGTSRNETSVAGSYGVANGFGLYDMHGNVWEWCADIWHDDYTNAPDDGSPWTSDGDIARRVIRGGSWYSHSNFCRSAMRTASGLSSKNDFLGFRVIASFSRTRKSSGNTTMLTLHWPETVD